MTQFDWIQSKQQQEELQDRYQRSFDAVALFIIAPFLLIGVLLFIYVMMTYGMPPVCCGEIPTP